MAIRDHAICQKWRHRPSGRDADQKGSTIAATSGFSHDRPHFAPPLTSRISGTVTVHEIKGNKNLDATPSPSTNIMTYKFNPAADVTDLTGKVAIVTGGK